MAREYGAICERGHRFTVLDGPTMETVAYRCDGCGRHRLEPRPSRRAAEHAWAHVRAGIPEVLAEEERVASELFSLGLTRGLRRWLGAFRRRALEREAARLAEARTRWLEAHPPPPLPEPDRTCACGGTFVQGAPIRCPECRTTRFEHDPSAPEWMVD